MRYISPTNLTYLEGQYLQLCRCVKLTLRTGEVRGFTDLDVDITISAVVYRAKVGLSVGALRWTNRPENEKTELEGIFSSETGGLTEAEARTGLYNGADVEIFLARWDNSTLVVPLKRGKISNFIPSGAGYTAEVQSLAYPLSKKPIVGTITLDCTAELGDTQCGFALTYSTGTVSGNPDASTLVAAGFTAPADPTDLIGGKFLFTSGTTWFVNQTKTYNNGTKTFTFWKPFPFAVGAWTFRAYEGCDKKFATCKDRFNNVVNYRGVPHVPDKDETALPIGPTMDNGGYTSGDGEVD